MLDMILIRPLYFFVLLLLKRFSCSRNQLETGILARSSIFRLSAFFDWRSRLVKESGPLDIPPVLVRLRLKVFGPTNLQNLSPFPIKVLR